MIKALLIICLLAGSSLKLESLQSLGFVPSLARGGDRQKVLLFNLLNAENIKIPDFNNCPKKAWRSLQLPNKFILKGGKGEGSLAFAPACNVKGEALPAFGCNSFGTAHNNFMSILLKGIKIIGQNTCGANIASCNNFQIFGWRCTIIYYGDFNRGSFFPVDASRNPIKSDVSTDLGLSYTFGHISSSFGLDPSAPNENQSVEGHNGANRSGDEHPKRPTSHPLLSVKIAVVLALLLRGLYFIQSALAPFKATKLTTDLRNMTLGLLCVFGAFSLFGYVLLGF